MASASVMEAQPPVVAQPLVQEPVQSQMPVSAPLACNKLLSVLIPQGIEAGQQVAFTTPEGQRLVVTAQERVPPGGALKVAYQPQAAAFAQAHLPAPTAAMTQADLDSSACTNSWLTYLASCWCCCCCGGGLVAGIAAPALWIMTAAFYFCKPKEQRKLYPRQRTPAMVSLVTCLLTLGVVMVLTSGLIGFGLGLHTGVTEMSDPEGEQPDLREVDWKRTFESCPAWGKYARTKCAEGPPCKKQPTKEESFAIYAELSRNPCKRVAEATGALDVAKWWAKHDKKAPRHGNQEQLKLQRVLRIFQKLGWDLDMDQEHRSFERKEDSIHL